MGRTDPLILDEVLKSHALSGDEERIGRFRETYFRILQEEMDMPQEGKRLCPGIQPLLDALSRNPRITLGLLTGNWRDGAYIKLRHFGIYGRFELGAFADDSAIRTDLVPVAMERFHLRKGFRVAPHNVAVIGDTPLDVACAKPHGTSTLAVATGLHTVEELRNGDRIMSSPISAIRNPSSGCSRVSRPPEIPDPDEDAIRPPLPLIPPAYPHGDRPPGNPRTNTGASRLRGPPPGFFTLFYGHSFLY